MDCEHVWRFQHIVYWDGYLMSGSSAHYREYADRFYCERCLAVRDERVREHGSSYDKPIAGAVPR